MNMMFPFGESYEVILRSTGYDVVKKASSNTVSKLTGRDDATKIHSDIENSSPVVEMRVGALEVQSMGLTAPAINSTVNSLIGSAEATEVKVDGEDIKVKMEYTDGEYKTIDQVRGIVLTTSNEGSVALTSPTDVEFVDSPTTMSGEDKRYLVTITGEYAEQANRGTENRIKN